MPHFFFNIHDGASAPDQEGTELSDLRAARAQAIETAGAILRENPDPLWTGHPWRMEVTDEERRVLITLYFSIHPPKLEG